MNQIKGITLLAAVAAGSLLIGCAGKGKGSAAAADSTQIAAVDTSTIDYNGKIVYIQLDSLMRGYAMAIDLQAVFSEKSEKAQAELTAKGRSLEREMREYQDKAQKGLITHSQAADIEAGLGKKQQSVLSYRDQVMQQLGEEETVMMNQVSNAIMEYMKKYNAEKGYSMIISTAGANTVLIADPSLNITTDVLEGLNAEYKAELAKKK